MLKLIKNFFAPKVETINIPTNQIETWLTSQSALLNDKKYFDSYSEQIIKIKRSLHSKAEKLLEEQLDSKHKLVEARIRNVVIGHKVRYAKTISRFVDDLDEQFFSEWNLAHESNLILDNKLNQLAKNTAKSYSASQHLFFDSVESIFQELAKLNETCKSFNAEVKKRKIDKLAEAKAEIEQLRKQEMLQKNLGMEISTRQADLLQAQQEITTTKEQLVKLKTGDRMMALTKLEQENKKLELEFVKIEQQAFSFLSKLQKPLKKYQRVALEDYMMSDYIKNSTETFWEDSNLRIIKILDGLENYLMQNGDNQKSIELIKSQELASWQKEGMELRKLIEQKSKEIEQSIILVEINESEQKINSLTNHKNSLQSNIAGLQSSMEAINLSNATSKVKAKIEEVFDKQIIIS